MKTKLLLAMLALLSASSFASITTDIKPMHGYIDNPASRAYLCSMLENKNCGPIQYEPQSVEGRKGFPQRGPADGKIASAGVGMFKQLDEHLGVWTIADASNAFYQVIDANINVR